MIDIEGVRNSITVLLSGARCATRSSLLNYTDRLLSQYSVLSKQLATIKEISTGWISAFVNRKAIRLLVEKLRRVKRDIEMLIRTYKLNSSM